MDICKSSIVAVLLLALAYSTVEASIHNITYSGAPVDCYVCNSHPSLDGEACKDPMDVTKINTTSCASGICLKYVQNVENEIKQINRGCALETEPVLKEKGKEEEGGCVLSTGTKLIQLEICNCKSDQCNGATQSNIATSILLSAGLLCFLAKLFQ